MRKVIGIGEIILDIIFKDNLPYAAVPGGSVFNGMVSLSRMGLPVTFLGELGDDRVGKIIMDFLHANNMSTEHIFKLSEKKTPVSLAFLNDSNNADYIFYTSHSISKATSSFPVINQDDILILASYYALNPLIRERIVELLEYAKSRKAIIYYDPNFRKSHASEAIRVRPSVIENYEFADIVRGSDEDFLNLYGNTDPESVYKNEVQYYCRRFISTHGSEGVNLFTESIRMHFDTFPIIPVSTIGAGDNFNAGIIYGLLKYNIGYHDLATIPEETWRKIIRCGIDFSTEVCQSYSNYLSPEFVYRYKTVSKCNLN
ncbi:MAG: carbohydrate kinase [Tannerella sp.]|jgi:fructokinase|nr:carbohydrate kinase [Tannerella sp.]